ncbi:polysaccharide lyase [Fibrivirga algicola]|uniref:Polysaccharide lyase n=1 Tax=Fibrivirga algicola TaxID=2950420 RepID=A0ABX0QIQ1_9BACT|nr:polysaccharide lyase [Fibrivirga algicola]NID12290.1 hypothetical protein [Fibrivirga algicola]
MRSTTRVLPVIAPFVLLATLAAGQQRLPIMTKLDFETTLLSAGWGAETCCAHSVQRSDSIRRAGTYSGRFELQKTDPIIANGSRSEVRYKPDSSLRVERWYGFSVFLPTDYKPDPDPEIIAQWHEVPDVQLGETWRSPPIALFSENGLWRLHVIWAKEPVNTNQTRSGDKFIELGAVEPGVWTDWVFHIRFSWLDDGLIEVYQQGRLLASFPGPNAYNDKSGTYFKAGLYKWGWMPKNDRGGSTTTKRVVYFDEIRIGNERATYRDVAPTEK